MFEPSKFIDRLIDAELGVRMDALERAKISKLSAAELRDYEEDLQRGVETKAYWANLKLTGRRT